MSSDSSDDDFSYTNTVSLLRNMTKKISKNEENTSTDSINITPIKSKILDNTSISYVPKIPDTIDNNKNESRTLRKCVKTRRNCQETQVNSRTESFIDLCNTPENNSTNVSEIESCAISDNEVDKSFNIISQIDACLERNNLKRRSTRNSRGRGGRGRGNKRKSTTVTRSKNKRFANAITVDTIEIDPDYPILNSEVPVPEEINYDLTIKVLWKSQNVQKFNIRRFEKLETIFKFFSAQENISEDRLLFTLKDRIISKTDTPYSLELTAASIIEGGSLSEKSYLSSGISYNSGTIELKVQMKDLKRPLVINMKVIDQMDILMSQCAEELKTSVKKLKFYFDGDIILSTDTPMKLELEGGECIDCVRL